MFFLTVVSRPVGIKRRHGELGTSEITIRIHRGQIMKKMGRSLLRIWSAEMAGKLGIRRASA